MKLITNFLDLESTSVVARGLDVDLLCEVYDLETNTCNVELINAKSLLYPEDYFGMDYLYIRRVSLKDYKLMQLTKYLDKSISGESNWFPSFFDDNGLGLTSSYSCYGELISSSFKNGTYSIDGDIISVDCGSVTFNYSCRFKILDLTEFIKVVFMS